MPTPEAARRARHVRHATDLTDLTPDLAADLLVACFEVQGPLALVDALPRVRALTAEARAAYVAAANAVPSDAAICDGAEPATPDQLEAERAAEAALWAWAKAEDAAIGALNAAAHDLNRARPVETRLPLAQVCRLVRAAVESAAPTASAADRAAAREAVIAFVRGCA